MKSAICWLLLFSCLAAPALAVDPPSDPASFSVVGRTAYVGDTLYVDGHHEYTIQLNVVLPEVSSQPTTFVAVCQPYVGCESISYALGSCAKQSYTAVGHGNVVSFTSTSCVNQHYANCIKLDGIPRSPDIPIVTATATNVGCQY